MATMGAQRVRLACDAGLFGTPVDALRSAAPAFYRGNDLRWELGLFERGALVDPSNLAELTVELREPGLEGAPPPLELAPLAVGTTTVFDDGVDAAGWADGSAQHAVVTWTADQTRVRPGLAWLAVSVATADAPAVRRTVLAGLVRVLADGVGTEPEPAAAAAAVFYTAGEADARFAAPSANLLVNGHFDWWQRGASFAATGYTADRWRLVLGAGAAATLARQAFALGQAEVPGNPAFFARLDRTAAGTAATQVAQRIAGVASGAGGRVTVSGWLKLAAAGTVELRLAQQFGGGGGPSAEVATAAQAVTAGTAWAYFERAFELPSVAGKILGTDGKDCLELRIELPTAAGVNTLDLARLRLDAGEGGARVERTRDEEGQLCLRYYQRLEAEGSAYANFGAGNIHNSTVAYYWVPFPARLRAVPTFSVSSPAHFAAAAAGASYAATSLTANQMTRDVATLTLIGAAMPSGQASRIQANNQPAAWLAFDAEL